MKKFYFGELSKVLLLLLVFTSFANFANAQINVTGQVKSGDDDSGLPGVNVIIKGTSVGTVTENDGRYSIEVPSPESVLIFSSIGYISEEISVGNQSVIDLTMVPDITSLEEVVVVGYGTQKKKDLTGSISTVNSEEFSRVPVVDPLQALSGRVAGLSITQTSGMPGAGTEVLVRGVQTLSSSDGNSLANRSKPIFVVDGNITDNIDYISPTDIESMTVLKDASAAAIYGSRAANGVILVTTKRGKVAGKPIITFNAYMGFQGETNLKPETLNSEDYLEIISEAYDNVGVTRPWSDDEFAQYEGVNTDWKDLMLRTGVIQNYNVGVAGSSESSNYFVSANYLNHKGRVLSSDYERYTLRFNSDHSINKWISFGNSLNVYSGETNGASSLYRSALVSVPITRAYEDDGSWGRIRNTDLEGGGNPLFSATRDVKNVVTRGILGNIYVTLEPVSGLKFTSRGSADWEHRYLTNFNPSGDPVLGYGGGTKNSLEKQQRQTLHTTVDFLADYSKTFGTNHSLTVLLGYSIEEWQRETLEGYIEDTPNNNIRYLSAGDPNSDQIYNGFNDWAFLSMFGRINYSLKDKYLLAATIRRDGTSRLIRENRWGNFPSVSAAWKLNNEAFMSGMSFINELKLRASMGTLGNVQALGNYATVAALDDLPGSAAQQIFSGYSFSDATNSSVVWEETVKKGIGLDASFFDSKIYTTIDYYIEDTEDLIFGRPIAVSAGKTGNPSDNGPSVRNSGFEFELGYSNHKGNWRYSVNANFTANKNKVTDLAGEDDAFRTQGIEVGQPVRSFYGYKSNGIIKTQADLDDNPYLTAEDTEVKKELGDIWWLDINGKDADGNLVNSPDGVVNANDRTIIGSRYPNFIYGLVGNISYKNVGLQIQLLGVQGVDKDISTQNDFGLFHYFQRWALNHDDEILDRWHATKNSDGDMPRVDITDKGRNRNVSDFWLRDASYLRIKNVNIYYNFSKDLLEKVRMNDLSVYFSVQNLYTFTSFLGNEVEYGEDRVRDLFPDTALSQDTDPFVGVPQPRTWTIGLKASF